MALALGLATPLLLGWSQLEGRRLRRLHWKTLPPLPVFAEPASDIADGGAGALAAAIAAWRPSPERSGLRWAAARAGGVDARREIVVGVLQGPWPYGEAELARTTVDDDGEGGICRAQIWLRPGVAWREASPDQPDAISLRAVLAHELGHALGFGHSASRRARMAAGLPEGSSRTDLHEDDLLALAAVYPPSFATRTGAAEDQANCGAPARSPPPSASADAREGIDARWAPDWSTALWAAISGSVGLRLLRAWRRRRRPPEP